MEMEHVLKVIAEHALLSKPPSTKVKLEELGMDSLDVVKMIESFEKDFAIHLEYGDISEFSTAADVLAVLKKRGA